MAERDREDGGWQPGCLVALGALVAVFAGFGAVMVACGNSLSRIGDDIAVPRVPEPLAAIPVPGTSCAPLRAVQLTAADAGRSWATVFTKPDDSSSWRLFADRLGPRLDRFDVALHTAVPRTPAPISAELRDVIRKVEVGREELPHARSEADYTRLTHNAVIDGYNSLSRASELVGDACGFTVAPGLDVIFATTTTNTLR